MWDVVIVGAGPGGLSTALYLAYYLGEQLDDNHVLLLDKDVLPGHNKPCGGMVSYQGLRILGDDLSIFDRILKGVALFYREYSYRITYSSHVAGNIDRGKLAQILLSIIKRLKIEVNLGVKVTDLKREKDYCRIITSEGEIRSKYVVGADGVFSIIRRKLLGRDLEDKHIGLAYQYRIEMDKNEISEIFGEYNYFYYGLRYAPHGYTWLFPHETFVKLGYGAPKNKIIKHKINLEKHLGKLMKMKEFSTKLENGEIIKREGFMVPLTSFDPNLTHKNILFVGDAARLTNPLTGEGIHSALISGRYAGYSLSKCLTGNNKRCFKNYENLIKRKFYMEQNLSRLIVDYYLRERKRDTKFSKRIATSLANILIHRNNVLSAIIKGFLNTQ